jgi:hypothetical protein
VIKADIARTYNVALRHVRVTIVELEKAIIIIITYSEFVFVALVMQHGMSMRRVILTYIACPAAPYSSTLSHKRRTIFVKITE